MLVFGARSGLDQIVLLQGRNPFQLAFAEPQRFGRGLYAEDSFQRGERIGVMTYGSVHGRQHIRTLVSSQQRQDTLCLFPPVTLPFQQFFQEG